MKPSKRSNEELKKSEALRLRAYRDTEGNWTIGWGTTAKAGVGIRPRPGMTITEAEAQHYFDLTISKFSAQLNAALGSVLLTQNQYDATFQLVYNIGITAFKRSSILRHMKSGDFDRAAKSFLLYNKERINGKLVKNKGLVKRRKREYDLFKTVSVARVKPRKVTRKVKPKTITRTKKRSFWSWLFGGR